MEEVTGCAIELFVGDLRKYGAVRSAFESFRPEAVVHYGEQPGAPYSMIDHNRAVSTQANNLTGTLNVLWAMRECAPQCQPSRKARHDAGIRHSQHRYRRGVYRD